MADEDNNECRDGAGEPGSTGSDHPILNQEVAIAAVLLGSFIEMWNAAVYCDRFAFEYASLTAV